MDSSHAESESSPTPPAVSPPSPPLSEQPEKASIRFLITNAAAGSVIGKGGATINEFQALSGARIQLSRNHEYFPGTSDRIISLTGTIKEVMTAFHLILSKVLSEAEKDNNHDLKPNQVKLIVPNPMCGAIIGKGGATIKSFVEESNASIKLSPLDQNIPGLNDRVVTIIGTIDQQYRAVELIVAKLSEDSNYSQFSASSLSYTGGLLTHATATGFPPIGYGGAPVLQNGMNGDNRMKGLIPSMVAPPGVPVIAGSSPSTNLNFTIPDEHVGAIVGRGGKIITDIQQSSGVRIKISDRGDYVPGTTDRKVTITGTAEGVRMAQQAMMQKINQLQTPDSQR